MKTFVSSVKIFQWICKGSHAHFPNPWIPISQFLEYPFTKSLNTHFPNPWIPIYKILQYPFTKSLEYPFPNSLNTHLQNPSIPIYTILQYPFPNSLNTIDKILQYPFPKSFNKKIDSLMFKRRFQCGLGWNRVKYARITITHVCFIA